MMELTMSETQVAVIVEPESSSAAVVAGTTEHGKDSQMAFANDILHWRSATLY